MERIKVRCVNLADPSKKRYFNINVTKGKYFTDRWKIVDPAYAKENELLDMPDEAPIKRDIQTEREVAREKERAAGMKLEQIPFEAITKEQIIEKLRAEKKAFKVTQTKGELYGLLYPQIKEAADESQKQADMMKMATEPDNSILETSTKITGELKEAPEPTILIDDITKKQIAEKLKEKNIDYDITSKKQVLYNKLHNIK